MSLKYRLFQIDNRGRNKCPVGISPVGIKNFIVTVIVNKFIKADFLTCVKVLETREVTQIVKYGSRRMGSTMVYEKKFFYETIFIPTFGKNSRFLDDSEVITVYCVLHRSPRTMRVVPQCHYQREH